MRDARPAHYGASTRRVDTRRAGAAVALAVAALLTVARSAAGNPTVHATGAAQTSPDVGRLVRATQPSVVAITATLGGARGRVTGAGVVVAADGLVVTNNHVIRGAITIAVLVPGRAEPVTARVAGYDEADDVAVLVLAGVAGLGPAPLAADREVTGLRVGDAVVTVGGRDTRRGTASVAAGRISALAQRVDVDGSETRERLAGMIAVTAPVQRGDSGGAVVDARGRVVAIVTAVAGGDTARVGDATPIGRVGYAIPIGRVLAVARAIESGRSTARIHAGPRAVLGVSVRDGTAAAGPAGTGGALVGLVEHNGPAATLGIRAGDVIVAIESSPVGSGADLNRALDRYRPGALVHVTWREATGRIRTGVARPVAGPPL